MSKKYEELEGYIWDKQVINKRFSFERSEPEFERFISLERKEPKVQGCKKLARNIIRNTMEIKLVPITENNYRFYRDFGQKFPFNAFLIYSLSANFLKPGKA